MKKNSVTTKSIRNGAVKGPKVATDTLTGANINESTLATVPDAARLGGQLPAFYQARVSGSCSGAEVMSAVNSDGSVVCTPAGTGDITGVTAGTGLSGGGTAGDVSLAADLSVVQARLAAGCSAGEALSDIAQNGTGTCFTPASTTQFMGSSGGNVINLSFLPPSGSGSTFIESQVAAAVPLDGIVSNLRVVLANAPGIFESRSVVMRVDGVDSGLACTISGASTTCNSSALIPVSAGQLIDLQHTATLGATNSTMGYGFTITS